MDIILAISSVYIFILFGFLAKRKLKEDIQEKSLVILSIYFLQPMLTFWGLSTKKIDIQLLSTPLIYLIISLICIFISTIIARLFFQNQKEKSIVSISSAIGNTGNLGIPIGIALLGDGSIIYTSLINVANILLVYTIGIFFYSRGKFSVKESLKNIIKLPLIWFATLALLLNYCNISIHPSIFKSLEMGAYSAMVLQLLIFGMYLYSIKLKSLNTKLLFHVGIIKFIIIPLVSIAILTYLDLEDYVLYIILLELLVPLALTNVNLSSLYDCQPIDVTSLVFFSSLFFIPYIVILSFFFSIN